MRLKPFDTTDVIDVEDIERRFVRANELRARAFAQGYITAVEDDGALLEHFKERACESVSYTSS